MNILSNVKLCLIFLLMQAFSSVQAQQTIETYMNDNVVLEADTYQGDIQWQMSVDGVVWLNLAQGNVSPFTTSVTALPSYFRAEITEPDCAPHYSEIITVTLNEAFRWSEVATWGGNGKPVAGDEVIIPTGTTILLDEDPPNLGGITIETGATLQFDRRDLNLTTEWIIVDGTLQIGTEASPFEQQAIITLNDPDPEADPTGQGMGTRGIIAMTGTLELHGATPDILWTRIDAHAQVGATSLQLVAQTGWNTGDEIVIAPTDYYAAGNGISITQRTTINTISGTQVSLSDGLNAFRWGLLQYPTETGMALAPTTVEPPVADTDSTTTPLILDERAEVGNMTRNIVVRSPEDALWNTDGFGVHIMIMPNATAHVEGIEISRGGQRARMRR